MRSESRIDLHRSLFETKKRGDFPVMVVIPSRQIKIFDTANIR